MLLWFSIQWSNFYCIIVMRDLKYKLVILHHLMMSFIIWKYQPCRSPFFYFAKFYEIRGGLKWNLMHSPPVRNLWRWHCWVKETLEESFGTRRSSLPRGDNYNQFMQNRTGPHFTTEFLKWLQNMLGIDWLQ